MSSVPKYTRGYVDFEKKKHPAKEYDIAYYTDLKGQES
jgi:hypothetical protein